MKILFYKNNQIDKEEWDEHIRQSKNGLIYAQSVYLDFMTEGWCVLKDEETQSIMPLPLKKKFGISYLYQPPFVQQLGIFSRQPLNTEIIDSFLRRAEEISKSISLYLNYENPYPLAKERCNYILNLSSPFENLKKKFRNDLISKPLSLNLTFEESPSEEVFHLYRKHIFKRKNKTLSEKKLEQFEKLTHVFMNSSRAFSRKIIDSKGEMLSGAIFFRDDRRIYYIMSANTENGRMASANALLLYEVIREHAGQNLIFDFEGSEIPGIKSFFEKFSPDYQPYFHFESNRLNPGVKGIKKVKDLLRKK